MTRHTSKLHYKLQSLQYSQMTKNGTHKWCAADTTEKHIYDTWQDLHEAHCLLESLELKEYCEGFGFVFIL